MNLFKRILLQIRVKSNLPRPNGSVAYSKFNTTKVDIGEVGKANVYNSEVKDVHRANLAAFHGSSDDNSLNNFLPS